MIRIARENIKRNIPNANCVLRKGNIEKLDYENETFDVVIASGVIEYLKTDGQAMKEMARVLKRNGILILNSEKSKSNNPE
jgi:ubiquinone/menaquinone biosynthesis C-methylase UbiE